MLNSVIRADLHIHSKASGYREKKYKGTKEKIVEHSDAAHLDVLLDKLRSEDKPEKRIDLFSITDHDRFDIDLYEKLAELLKSEKYGKFATVLPGVEFTVLLEEGRKPVHVVTIFDVGVTCWADNWHEKLEPIAISIEKDKLIQDDESYAFNRFLELLATIGYRAILIAHQFDGLQLSTARGSSLSNATSKPEEYLTYGVFDALEYTKTKVEGILLHELKAQRLPPAMVAGSDCHDWRCYPRHDREETESKKDRFFVELKCLPTFRGLLCALSSPETRLRISDYPRSRRYVESVLIEGAEVNLSPGINAIIGENGSGKSTLLEVIGSVPIHEKWRTSFIKDHSLECPNPFVRSEVLYVRQGELVTEYGKGKGTLFKEDLFPDIATSDNQQFESAVRQYADELKKYLTDGIARRNREIKLENTRIDLSLGEDLSTHALEAALDNDYAEVIDPYAKHADRLKQAVGIILEEAGCKEDVYTQNQRQMLENAAAAVDLVRSDIQEKSNAARLEAAAKGIIQRALKSYSDMIQSHRTTADTKNVEIQAARRSIVNTVLEAAKDEASPREFPSRIDISEELGFDSLPKGGFEFSSETAYHSMVDITNELIEKLFNLNYHSEGALKAINTNDMLENAVSGGRGMSWDERWDKHIDAFIEESKSVATSIGIKPGASVGGTLGEQSLAYYKFQSNNAVGEQPILIDQPEDNISNSSIVSDLVKDLSTLRNSRQVILVTHNPLLVVNLDVDNIVALERKGEKLIAHSGCLESTDDGDMLDLVAAHMDGGRDAIRKRLKLYGQHRAERSGSN